MTSYATVAQLNALGIASEALASFADADKETALEAASRRADSYLRSRYAVPIAAADSSLAEAVCAIAAYWLLGQRGYDPTNPGDQTIKVRRDEAIEWLKMVRAGDADLDDGTDSTAGTGEGFANIQSRDERGWGEVVTDYDDEFR